MKIKGVQKADKESDETQLYTKGLFYKKNDVYYLTYKETESTGYEGCTSIIKVKPDKVSLIRQGNAKTNMIVEKRQRNIGHYSTPMGQLVVGITGKNIDMNLSQEGGKVKFSYLLDINAQFISENSVTIEVFTSSGIEV